MVVVNNESATTKNAGKLLAILIAMRMRRYDAGRITQWSMSRASLLGATGCRHRLSACTQLPRWPPWLTNSNETTQITNKTQLLASNYGIF